MPNDRSNDNVRQRSSQQSRRTDQRETQQSSTAVALGQISQTVSKNTQEVKSNTSALNQNTGSLDAYSAALDSFARTFIRNTRDLTDSLDDTADSINDAADQAAGRLRSATTDMSQTFERSSHNIDQSLTAFQKIGKGLMTTFSVVGGRLISEFTGGAERVAESYKSQFSDITVKMQIDRSEYSAMFSDIAKTFTSQGLNRQFSAVDFAESLATVLNEGLRGDEAQRQAYQNLIASKLIPAISTNTVAYRKMSKEFGDAFSENVVAMTKYSESLYGAQGIEEGKLNNVIDSLQTTLDYTVATGQMTQDQALESLNKFMLGVNAMEDAGIDTDDLVSNINAILEGNIDAVSSQFHAMGIGTADSLVARLRDDTFGLIGEYLDKNSVSRTSLATQNEVTSILGGNVKTGMQIVAALESGRLDWEKVQESFEEYDQTELYDQLIGELQDGFGQTADAMVDKTEENAMTDLGVFEAEVPRFDKVADDVSQILSTLVDLVFFTKTQGLSSGGVLGGVKSIPGKIDAGLGGLKFFGGGGSLVGNANAAAELLNGGFTFSEVAQGGYGIGGATLGKIGTFGGAETLAGGLTNLAAGPAALVAGGTMAVLDAVDAGQVAADQGYGANDVAMQSLRGLITGETMMTADEEAAAVSDALSGKGRDFDWGALGENTLKGTFIGAGVGTMAGGWAAGIGTVVGAAGGALVGAVTNVVDQLVENAKYNELADASSNLSTSMDKLTTSQRTYDSVVKTGTQSREEADLLLNAMTGETTASAEELDAAFSSLQEKYPEYLGNLDSITELEPQYIEALKNKISLEKEAAGAELSSAAFDALGALNEVGQKFDNIAAGNIKSDAAQQFVQTVMDQGGENGHTWQSSEIGGMLDMMIRQYGTPDMTREDLIEELNSGESGKLITIHEDGSYTLTGQNNLAGAGGATWGDNFQQWLADYANSDATLAQAKQVLNEGEVKLNEAWKAIESQASASKTEDGDYEFSERTASDLKTLAKEFDKAVVDYNSRAEEYKLGSYKLSSKENYPEAAEIFEAVGAGTPSFKVGAYNIPEDDTLANLHQNEMVLTASNADKLRNLGSGGIDSLLEGLVAVSQLRSSEKSEDIVGTIIPAMQESLNTQTNALLSAVPSEYSQEDQKTSLLDKVLDWTRSLDTVFKSQTENRDDSKDENLSWINKILSTLSLSPVRDEEIDTLSATSMLDVLDSYKKTSSELQGGLDDLSGTVHEMLYNLTPEALNQSSDTTEDTPQSVLPILSESLDKKIVEMQDDDNNKFIGEEALGQYAQNVQESLLSQSSGMMTSLDSIFENGLERFSSVLISQQSDTIPDDDDTLSINNTNSEIGLLSSTVRDLVSLNTAQAQAVAPVLDTSILQSSIAAAIDSQTNSIVSVLNMILGTLQKFDPVSSIRRDNSATISEGLINFAGV